MSDYLESESMLTILFVCDRTSEVEADEYNDFYKSISKKTETPMTHIHFTAEGEVTFKSILFIPAASPADMFQNYGKKMDGIKVYNKISYTLHSIFTYLYTFIHLYRPLEII